MGTENGEGKGQTQETWLFRYFFHFKNETFIEFLGKQIAKEEGGKHWNVFCEAPFKSRGEGHWTKKILLTSFREMRNFVNLKKEKS